MLDADVTSQDDADDDVDEDHGVGIFSGTRCSSRSKYHQPRMAPEDFDHLLSLTSEKIRKSSTNFRDSIPAYDKLAVTLRFLATGDSYESLMYFTKMSKSTICNAISKVCAAINEALQDYAKSILEKREKKSDDSKRSGKGKDEVYEPRLWYFSLLSFLDDQIFPMSSTSNIESTSSDYDSNIYPPDTQGQMVEQGTCETEEDNTTSL
ncbi:Uncharacterized protein OBRU01_24218 [Operophtera brumata]|uniref:Nuclease HARBI1 n=1 Tax=Operophtera brumata TaxID=104452 RepID=A0A0L7KNJ9_OPEBR|nr:Uncharacterized protein OBRU01_24218 [Operophtera brumata]